MAKTKVTPGWVGPIKQANEGKRPFYCDYGDWGTGDKKRQKLGYKKKDAEREYLRFNESMESKAHTPKSARTFGDALDAYERRCEERNRNWVRAGLPSRRDPEYLASGTLYVTRSYIESNVRPQIGHIRLDALTTADHLQPLINDLTERFAAAHERIAQIIKLTLEYIKEDLGWITRSPLEIKKLKIPPRRQPHTSIPTIEEGRAIWHSLQERAPGEQEHAHLNRVAAFALAMFGGCEKGVIAGLHWEDVDWVNGVINIRRSWSRYSSSARSSAAGTLKGPKTQFRVRTIPMAAEIYGSLGNCWNRDGRLSTGYALSTRGKSRFALYEAISKHYLTLALRNAGFVDERGKPLWRFHDLRATLVRFG